jgi:hypothetical protein
MLNRVVVKRVVQSDLASVFDWFYRSENFKKSPIVFKSAWRKESTRWAEGSVRDIVMIAGWYREEITAVKENEYIQYRVIKSFPSVRQDFTEIRFRKIGNAQIEVIWTIEIEVPVPGIGKAMGKAAGKMAGTLYGTIMTAGKKELEKRALNS